MVNRRGRYKNTMPPKNKKLEYKGILRFQDKKKKYQKKMAGAEGGLYKREMPNLP